MVTICRGLSNHGQDALFGIHKRIDSIECLFSYFLAKKWNALPDVIRTSAFTEFN